MAMEIVVAPAAKSKEAFPRRIFLRSLGAALAGASAITVLPASVSAALSAIGESHPRAKLTEHEKDLIRELCEDEARMKGKKGVVSYRDIAARFAAISNAN